LKPEIGDLKFQQRILPQVISMQKLIGAFTVTIKKIT